MSRVAEFHRAFGTEDPSIPSVPSHEVMALRLRLISEEFRETKAEADRIIAHQRAGGNPHELIPIMQNLVKELCDLRYVVEGTLLAAGVTDPDAPYDEVHRSNMSKLGADGKPIRREDGKVLKGPNYRPVDPDKMFPQIIEGTAQEDYQND